MKPGPAAAPTTGARQLAVLSEAEAALVGVQARTQLRTALRWAMARIAGEGDRLRKAFRRGQNAGSSAWASGHASGWKPSEGEAPSVADLLAEADAPPGDWRVDP